MGMLDYDIPLIDTIGAQVNYISGVIFERLGNQVLAIRYLETTTNGVTTREIVGKDAISIEALATEIERAQMFLRYMAEHPTKDLLTVLAKH
jgi:hypothetical protein